MKIEKLTRWVGDIISLNKSRAKCLMRMMTGMITLRTVNLNRLSQAFRSTVQDASHERTMSRFLKEIQINSLEILRFLRAFLNAKKINKIGLIVDRTNWKRGKKHLNFLFIALKTKDWTIPIWVLPICEQKRGNHSLAQLESALDEIFKVIPAKKIDYFLGDTEFGALNRIKLFQEKGIPYIVRLKEEWNWAFQGEERRYIHEWFRGLPVGKSRTLVLQLGEKAEVTTSVTAKRLEDGSLVILAHNSPKRNPLDLYRFRWSIETLFRSLKTNQFNIESTGITDPLKLRNLIHIIILCFLFVLDQAQYLFSKFPIPFIIKAHGYPPKSYWRSLFDRIQSIIFNQFIPFFSASYAS